ncbi:MAG: ABC transporter ATP-binding protein, partial [Acidimicrobiales bacterium]
QRLRQGLVPVYRSMALIQMTPRYVLELCMLGAATTIAAVAFSTEPLTSATATLGLFVVGGFRLLAPLNSVIFGNAQAKAAAPSLAQIISDVRLIDSADGPAFDVSIASPGSDAPRMEEADTRPIEPRIRFDDVSFSYQIGEPVLRNVSFEVAPCESVGLVGSSGAGKSTLVDVLLGLLEPDGGTVSIGGTDLRLVRRRWNRMIGYVPQSIALFDDSVRANVAFGDPPDDAQVWKALRLAQLEEFVLELPAGLDTVVGEAATRLSGGQRQRLGVARALYRGPDVLIFDEATSALDNETEFRLTEVLERLRSVTTTITIAHRLSTVRGCDRVLYLDKGTLVAQGTFAELVAEIPGFARMVKLSSVTPT